MSEVQFIGAMIFILGTCVGSFLNVCIVRMPFEKSVVRPGSHCPACKAPICWYNNIPVFSYFILGGKCSNCAQPYSIRYMFVELLTGLSFVGFYLYFGLDAVLWPYLFMLSCFIVATFVDFEHRIIPDEISVGGMCFGILFSALIPELHGVGYVEPWWKAHAMSFGISLLGVLIGGGSIYAMGLLGDFLFKKESMGGGDIKLMALVGAFLGWKLALLAFFISPFFGAVFGIVEKIRTNDTTIPYGPFLVLGSLLALFYGDQILLWIANGYRF